METGKLLEILPVAERLTDGADKAGFSEYLQQPREGICRR